MTEGERPRKGALREYSEAVGIALVVALLLRFFVVEAFQIPSGSMIQNLLVGDYIFVNKLSYRTELPWGLLGKRFPGGGTTLVTWSLPQRGDVAVFRWPNDPDIDYIKRIVALPGDTIEGRGGELWINGTRLKRRFVRSVTFTDKHCVEHDGRLYEESLGERTWTVITRDGRDAFEEFGPLQVREGHLFAMGDNRDNSEDSRAWGQVPVGNLKGEAMLIWLSLDKCRPLSGRLRLSRVGSFVR